ncbi:phospholipase A1-like [Contarinia nasturtii]|uniref:phospholipase A1-like n=1 Tax=Contarinia nasturtii TaxID=265458 RepID=UPI0012D3ED27|nr:phospholipase A1-like [Contarinia nasturtii]
MNWGIYSIVAFVLLTSSLSNAMSPLNAIVKQVKSNNKKSIKSIKYVEPALFACIYDESMTGFDVVKSNDKAEMLELSEKLSRGKDLSLFFLGTGNTISANDERFTSAKEWFMKSGTNVCYIAYAFGDQRATLYNLYFYLKKIVKTNRVEYVAKEAFDFISNIQQKCIDTQMDGCLKNMSQIVMVGYSLGAHIAGYTCRYLSEKTGEKVKKVIGLDPAGISHLFPPENYLRKGDAQYVQIIHSSLMGTTLKLGDADIFIKSDKWHPYKNHKLAVKANNLASGKRAILIASKKGNGRVIDIQEGKSIDFDLKSDECLLGVYNDGDNKEETVRDDENQEKNVFKISLMNRLVKSLSF